MPEKVAELLARQKSVSRKDGAIGVFSWRFCGSVLGTWHPLDVIRVFSSVRSNL